MVQKKVIPFKYYWRFVVISLLFIIAISTIIYTNFMNDDKYNFPFVKIMKEGKEVVRIYPASSFNTPIADNKTLSFNAANDLIGKSFTYEKIADYNFGSIDYYQDAGVYKVFNRFDNNYLTMYQKDNKIVGLTYKYIYNKSSTSEFPEREFIYQDIARLEKIIGDNYTVESNKGSKNFITKVNEQVYIYTIFAEDISGETLGAIASSNKAISLNISVFDTSDSYNDFKLNTLN